MVDHIQRPQVVLDVHLAGEAFQLVHCLTNHEHTHSQESVGGMEVEIAERIDWLYEQLESRLAKLRFSKLNHHTSPL